MDGGGGGGHMPGEENGAEKLMDDYLKSIGLHRKKIAKDGSCLFRAVAEQVLHCQSLHTKVRAKCVVFLKRNRESYEAFIEGDFEDYLCKLQDPQHWVGEVEINALAAMYKRDFLIFQEPGKAPVNITDKNFKDKVQLCFLNGNHYDSVYPVSHIKNAALCQSILYEVLYDGVFNVDRGSLGPCQRAGRASDFLSDDNMAACPSSDESDPDTDEPFWVENGTKQSNHSYRGRGRGRPLPERVRRSLNPTLLRNIEFDVWHKTKRAQHRMDFCIAAGMQYTVGDRCQVRLEGTGRTYKATIKEVPTTKDNMVTVHLEELGTREVPLWSLRPPSDDSSWSTVVNKDKRLSNGCGDWAERGKGRGRGKSVPPPPASAPQAVTAGPSGRVQKQHSWPPQATVEEQGGAKSSRKSVSAVDTASFGLTEKQRLAKEEEERNVALLEIQLRDENSFPALGTQGDGGRKKMAQGRRSQRNKTMSPVEDVRAVSPSAGERPKSSTPPPATPAAPTNHTLLPAAAAPAAPTNHTLLLAAPASAAPINPTLLPTAAAPATKSNTHRSSPPPPAAAAKPPGTSGALPPSVPCSASVFSFLPPVLPTASSPALSSPPPPTTSSSASPPPHSLLPQPTFIAPIALSPGAAQGFHPPSSLHRTSPPAPSLPHSPSPPTSSSSLIHPPASQVQATPLAAAQTPNALADSEGSLTKCQASQSQSHMSVSQTPMSQTPVTHSDVHTPASLPKIQPQIEASLPQSPVPMPQTQTENQSSIPRRQSLTEVSQNQIQASVPQSQPQVQSDIQIQESHPPPGATYPLTPQASVPGSAQPPQPSQLPHPSLCVSASPTHPSLHAQGPDARIQTEAPCPPTQPYSQQPHHPQSIPGPVPLQNLAQLYLDPLYPGFPQRETGDMAQTPSFSSNRSGDDLPQDFNILRFFFNLGVKAYSMPLFPPYLYLLPLQHAHTLQPRPRSRSPSPHFPPTRHQESYPQYPPSPQYGRQAPPTEPPSSSFIDQVGYPVAQPPAHRMTCAPPTWQQQHQTPPPTANSGYPVGYPSPAPPYPLPPPSSQGYHPAQGTGHPMYPPTMPPYALSSLGYQSSSTPEEHQGAMEKLQPPNGDAMPGRGPGHGPSPLEGPAAANVTNANNNNRAMMLPGVNSFALKEQGESLTRTVLLVDPPLNNRPILALVSNSSDPVSMAAMNPSSSPGSPSPYGKVSNSNVPGDGAVYRVHPGHFNPGKTYISREHLPPAMPTMQALSVGCSTEDDWEEQEGFKPPILNNQPRGAKRPYRRGRGRGGGAYDGGRGGAPYDGGRGGHRRRQGEGGYNYTQYSPAHRGRGW